MFTLADHEQANGRPLDRGGLGTLRRIVPDPGDQPVFIGERAVLEKLRRW